MPHSEFQPRARALALVSAVLLANFALGCGTNSDGDSSAHGSGGSSATGGASASGGSTGSSDGGTANTGGQAAGPACLTEAQSAVVQDVVTDNAAFCTEMHDCLYPLWSSLEELCARTAPRIVADMEQRPTTTDAIQAECTKQRDNCLAQSDFLDDANRGIQTLRDSACGDYSKCSKNVSDLETCIADLAAIRTGAPPCEELTQDNIDMIQTRNAPPSCTALTADCL